MSFDGQTALVTGGGRGIGQAICVELADRGADVVVADLDEEEMAETKTAVRDRGRRAVTVRLDLREPTLVDDAVEAALDAFGTVEILVNNAGIGGPSAACEDVSIEAWDDTLDINLRGAFLMCRALVPAMKAQEYGRIVNVASITGKRPLYHRLPYAASKMGLIGLTRTLAAEVGEHGINVNAVCPGSVEGPRLEWVYEKQAEATGRPYEEVVAEAAAESPQRSLVSREEVARVVAFLCSDDAVRMTGQDLNVSAGKVTY